MRLDWAACLAHDGEPEAAVDEIRQTLVSLTREQREGIIAVRARQVIASVPASRERHSPLAELRQVLERPAQ